MASFNEECDDHNTKCICDSGGNNTLYCAIGGGELFGELRKFVDADGKDDERGDCGKELQHSESFL